MVMIGVMGERRSPMIEAGGNLPLWADESDIWGNAALPKIVTWGQNAEVETMCKKNEEGALPIVDADAVLTGVVLLVIVK